MSSIINPTDSDPEIEADETVEVVAEHDHPDWMAGYGVTWGDQDLFREDAIDYAEEVDAEGDE